MTRMRVVVPRPGTRTFRMPTGPSPAALKSGRRGKGMPCSRSSAAASERIASRWSRSMGHLLEALY